MPNVTSLYEQSARYSLQAETIQVSWHPAILPASVVAMLLDLFYTLSGFTLLVWGADRFSAGAGALARLLGVTPIVIGLTVVAFATSAPEIMVSVSAAREGLTGMAVGNAIGSNIANIGLVLGASVLLQPVRHDLAGAFRAELLALLGITVASALLFLDGRLDFHDGVILSAALVAFLYWVAVTARRIRPDDPLATEVTQELPPAMPAGGAAVRLLIGLATLLIGAEVLVTGAASLARDFGVSDLIIGLTIVAVGTSLPELAVTLVSALRGESGIAVGNVIGSNVFNLLAVIGAAGLVGPGSLDPTVLRLHYPVMLLFTLALLRLTYNLFGKPGMGRGMGFVLLAGYMSYQAYLLTGGL